MWLGQVEAVTWDHFQTLATGDGKINLDVPLLSDWIREVEPARESEALTKGHENYPFVMSSGRHMDYNANTGMRNPAWNHGKRACTAIIHPDDAENWASRMASWSRSLLKPDRKPSSLKLPDPPGRDTL